MPLNALSLGSLVAGEFNLRGDSSKFIVVFDDVDYDLGAWSRASGLSVSWDPLTYYRGDTNQMWTAPGIAKYSKISLTRATCMSSQSVQDWLAETSEKPKVFSGAIKLLTWAGIPLVTWTLKEFVPLGWKIADFETKAATLVMETLELGHNGFLDDDFELDAPKKKGPKR